MIWLFMSFAFLLISLVAFSNMVKGWRMDDLEERLDELERKLK